MRWPWTKSERAAEAALHRAKRDEPKVNAVVKKSTQLREENGFGLAIMRSMGDKR